MSARREKIVRALVVLGATVVPFGFVAATGWWAWRRWGKKSVADAESVEPVEKAA